MTPWIWDTLERESIRNAYRRRVESLRGQSIRNRKVVKEADLNETQNDEGQHKFFFQKKMFLKILFELYSISLDFCSFHKTIVQPSDYIIFKCSRFSFTKKNI